jgi:hypothetical protein
MKKLSDSKGQDKQIAGSKETTKPEQDATKILDDLLERDAKEYQIKRPFMRAQYHQCVPNPQKHGELITVQLVSMWALGYTIDG